jgi:hypothetical protein
LHRLSVFLFPVIVVFFVGSGVWFNEMRLVPDWRIPLGHVADPGHGLAAAVQAQVAVSRNLDEPESGMKILILI